MLRSHHFVNPERERLRGALHRAQGGRCGLCGGRLRNMLSVTLDHVLPKSRGGMLGGNVVAAHANCNLRKGDRMPTGCELIMLLAVNAVMGTPAPAGQPWCPDYEDHVPGLPCGECAR